MPRKPPARSRSSIPKGRQRAKSWVYYVINPLVSALEAEKRFLEKGNLTFRFRDGQPEYVGLDAQDYLDPNGRLILRDWLRSEPGEAERLERHFAMVKEAASEAAQLHQELSTDLNFGRELQRTLGEFQSSGGEVDRYLSDNLARLAAERLVNGITELPANYSDAEFWRQCGASISKEFAATPRFDRFRTSLSDAANDAQDLINHLESKRDEYCDRFDIPAAPVDLGVPDDAR